MEPFHISSSIPTATAPYWTDMDPRIWSRLPQRLMDRTIACLPPPAFFRARAVCKRWYALLFSNAFLQLYLQASPRHHYFIFFRQQQQQQHHHPSLRSCCIYSRDSSSSSTSDHHHHRRHFQAQEGYLFDPDNLKWYRIPFPLIPPGFSPASSSGGLVCWVSDDSSTGSKRILLCNPVTGAFSSSSQPQLLQLPSTLRPRLCPSMGMSITASSIDVVFAGDDLISPYAVKNLTSESLHVDGAGFYSIWGTTAPLPRLCSLDSGGGMVHVRGRFYCMNYSPYSVLAYDVSRNGWSKIQAPMRRFLRSPSLVESRGKLVLVAAVEKSKLNVPRSLRMWALQEEEEERAWVEVERMPQRLYSEFAEMEAGRGFRCAGQGEVLLLMLPDTRALVFHTRTKRWVWAPPCPHRAAAHTEQQHLLQGFAYEPRLAVPVTPLLQQLQLTPRPSS
ncbi:protein UNUSUAL FLORAL ORGANS [Andrographis paniculata]|uniref:protein UNUSUAL FLORAL ORGANS n=1 Tax=Andrographis paniculata TaxID=175694 RepID=UPI0021E94BF8|nr:protein UNUSUAL FLORAL ORGANS [Andrographis paniculata]